MRHSNIISCIHTKTFVSPIFNGACKRPKQMFIFNLVKPKVQFSKILNNVVCQKRAVGCSCLLKLSFDLKRSTKNSQRHDHIFPHRQKKILRFPNFKPLLI